jgi:hypothetical protein
VLSVMVPLTRCTAAARPRRRAASKFRPLCSPTAVESGSFTRESHRYRCVTDLLALASSEASAFTFVCQAVSAPRSVGWDRSFFVAADCLSRCARRSGICPISYCVPGYDFPLAQWRDSICAQLAGGGRAALRGAGVPPEHQRNSGKQGHSREVFALMTRASYCRGIARSGGTGFSPMTRSAPQAG